MKRWKLAISLAVIAAVAVPAITGVWRLAPGKWIDLTPPQKQRISDYLDRTNYCRSPLSIETPDEEATCNVMMQQFSAGGSFYPPERVTTKYLLKVAFVVIVAFSLTFALVMAIPTVGRRYWSWLRS
jgi:hypothetical protein